MTDWLNDNQGAVLIVLTVALVVIGAATLLLMWRGGGQNKELAEATKRHARVEEEQVLEVRKARSQEIRPVVSVVRVNGTLAKEPSVVVRNVGKGGATNGTARIEWRGSPFKEHTDWSLSPDLDKDRRFTFEKDEGEAQETVDVQPRVVIECDGMDGVRWRFVRKLRVDENTGSLDLGEELVPEEVSRDS